MELRLRPVAHLLVAVILMEVGDGLQGVLVPIRAGMEGFSTQSIGLLGTAYYLGFVTGCMLVPLLIRRVGHIRVFSGMASIAAAAFLLHEFIIVVGVWFILRFVIGVCFSGLFMTVESWLNHHALSGTRGRILAAYTLIGWIAVIAGKLIFSCLDPRAPLSFALVSMGICLAVVPVAFSPSSMPAPAPSGTLRVRELFRASPVGVIGCLCVGAANGAFWSLAPLYAQWRGLSTFQIGLFIGIAVLGGAVTQWPLGRWSDQTDRRRVIASTCIAASVSAAVLVAANSGGQGTVMLLAFLFGASALPLYALCVAHANDQTPADSFVEVSGGLLTLFGLGAIAGPYIASLLMISMGGVGVFVFTGAVHLSLAGFTILRMRLRVPVPATDKAPFVIVPKTTQAVLLLDPRAPTDDKVQDAPDV